MNWEWKKQSRNGKGFLHVGFGTADAVGTEHPASDIPIGEGLRLLMTKAVDRWWMIALAGAALHRLTRRRKR
ncbi:MAG: hypothetical protein IKS42_10415 [Oscillospiraceae bacterium]|nr:hypothetical protein [Oscillospiraceae bacterium]